MAKAPAHHKKMKYFMASEIFMAVIKNRKLQCIDDTANGVYDAAGQQPAESSGGHGVKDLSKCEDASPAHADIQDRGYPLGAIHPECFDQDPGNRDAPHNRKKDNTGLAAQDKQADWRIAAGNKDTDHHVVNFLQNGADPL